MCAAVNKRWASFNDPAAERRSGAKCRRQRKDASDDRRVGAVEELRGHRMTRLSNRQYPMLLALCDNGENSYMPIEDAR